MQPLNEVAAFVEENHHLPGIPSASEVASEGINEEENRELRDRIARLEVHTAAVQGGK